MNKILFPFLLSIFFFSCKEKGEIRQDQFPYQVTVTAPQSYPIEIHRGYFSDENKELICGVPKTGKEDGGWQYDGDAGGQGSDVIPSHLTVTYVAYAEKKFYTVEGALPKDKMLQLFRESFIMQGENNIIVNGKEEREMIHSTYDRITLGIAPGGIIIVWLTGNHHRKEIARLQGKESFVDKDDFRPNPDPDETQQQFFDTFYEISVPDSIQQEIKTQGIPFGRWDAYREKFKYRFVLNPYDGKDHFTHNYYLFFNGEADEFFPDVLDKNEYFLRGIPYDCTFMMTKYNTEIFFNDQEMLEVFNYFKKKYPDKPIDIIITPTFMYNDINVSVKCEDEEIKLQKYKMDGVYGG